MRAELFDLAALETFEAGKTWREADADVGEAIDFLEYYGREAIRLAAEAGRAEHSDVVSSRSLRPLGVVLVVAPWNFPLAILTGMTSAALVAGNSVIVKPAGPTPVIAAQLVRLFDAAGAPPGTVNFLPAPGATVGESLVHHPDVDMIAFTGSKEVGLRIISEAAANPARSGAKRVIAEMGGKNAIIVDDDADLDVAVLESIASAFHYQGQKCSAASRIIVLEGAYDEFLRRFVDAARSVVVGLPEDPVSRMGPVITAEAKRTIEAYIERGKSEGRAALVTEPPAGGWPNAGFFIGPHIFADVAPDAVIAQEEIFGPVVAVIKARRHGRSPEDRQRNPVRAHRRPYLTKPATIERVRREFRVGNLYINRGITGALVERQAFGGFKMSGIGSKAGGPDYLLQFMTPEAPLQQTSKAIVAQIPRRRAGRACPGARREPGERGCATRGERRDNARRGDCSGLARPARCETRGGNACVARLIRQNSRELQARLLDESPAGEPDAVRRASEEVQLAAESLEACAELITRIDTVRRMGHQPGELNHYFYQARGLVLVLGSSAATPTLQHCAMAGAALAAGDPVVIKPE